ncbi:MAG: hypothetical protein JJE12_07325 [Anaerolineales bacterium]|nr:hypothetical protein [Anaerolineales bacterium]
MYKIKIKFDKLSFNAELNDSPTSKAIWDQLPIESRVNTWGEEIYFEIPVDMPQKPHAQEILSVGDLAYWPVGQAFCIFFGPTPVSTDDRPRAYSPVNLLGKILDDCDGLRSIQNQETVRIEQLGSTP